MIPKRPKGGWTADEFMNILEKDPDYIAMRAEKERRHAEFSKMLEAQERPLVQDLAAVGVMVDSIGDLVNTKSRYAPAIPILLKHLTLPYHENIADMIARALAVREAAYAWDFIVAEYLKEPNLRQDGKLSSRKGGLAVAVANAMPLDRWEDFVDLLLDQKNGSRILMMWNVEKADKKEAERVLNLLEDDPVLADEVGRIRKRWEKARLRKAARNAKN
jgi:hypothetical protein